MTRPVPKEVDIRWNPFEKWRAKGAVLELFSVISWQPCPDRVVRLIKR